jgi:hypothetical protein
MAPFVTDPVVLICSGIILFGFLGLIWAIAKFRHLGKTLKPPRKEPFDDVLSVADLKGIDLSIPSPAPAPRAPAPSPAPAGVSKDVADRLDSMAQRLAEMQTVLQKQQSASQSADAQGGPVGQGFSPETIDKLLKIIGNVIQQVDVLQKNMSPSREAPKADNPSAPAAQP